MASLNNNSSDSMHGGFNNFGHAKCPFYFLFHYETTLGNGLRGFLYFLALAYCFIGLSSITDRFFRSMESVVKHSRAVEEIDPNTKAKVVRSKKVWNYAIADIALLAFGTSFPQISLATIDAIRNIGKLYAGEYIWFSNGKPIRQYVTRWSVGLILTSVIYFILFVIFMKIYGK